MEADNNTKIPVTVWVVYVEYLESSSASQNQKVIVGIPPRPEPQRLWFLLPGVPTIRLLARREMFGLKTFALTKTDSSLNEPNAFFVKDIR